MSKTANKKDEKINGKSEVIEEKGSSETKTNYRNPIRLGEKLKAIREYNGWTQAVMLELIRPGDGEANRGRISQYENNVRVPSLKETARYAAIASIPMEVLVYDDKELPKKFRKNKK